MALICQNIMLTWGEGYAIDQDLVTGQDWFDAFKRRAESLDKQYSDEDMEKLEISHSEIEALLAFEDEYFRANFSLK